MLFLGKDSPTNAWPVSRDLLSVVTVFLTFLECCTAERGSLMDIIHSLVSTSPQCDVPLSGETPEVDVIVRQAISRDHNNLESVADSLYQLANSKLVGFLSILPTGSTLTCNYTVICFHPVVGGDTQEGWPRKVGTPFLAKENKGWWMEIFCSILVPPFLLRVSVSVYLVLNVYIRKSGPTADHSFVPFEEHTWCKIKAKQVRLIIRLTRKYRFF